MVRKLERMDKIEKMNEIYTIGYGDKEFVYLVQLLKNHHIERVVDVRHFPTSKWPKYRKENLKRNFPREGIEYFHLEKLGGYRHGYEEWMESEDFKEGLGKLTDLAEEKKTALMCLESYPSGCHRRFIAGKLEEKGWEVIHLVGRKGKVLEED